MIAGVAFGTYLIRLSFIQAWQWIAVPEALSRALRYVPPAVFAALIFPALTVSGGTIDLSPDNLRLVAGVIAALVAWYTRSVLLTLGAGMGGLWTLQYFT
jgi:branched-subunit amino acid transport protein